MSESEELTESVEITEEVTEDVTESIDEEEEVTESVGEEEEVTESVDEEEEVTESVGEEEEVTESVDEEEEEEEVTESVDEEEDREELARKYDMLSSKLVGDKTTYKELKKGTDTFNLSIWDDCKVSEQTAIEFETRKKKMVKGLYTCKKCGCNEVYTQAIQMRSGDEATDNFALCSKCQNLWRV